MKWNPVLIEAERDRREILERLGVYNPTICPDCEGSGFMMVCYGKSPVERDCETCYGDGYLDYWAGEETYP